ncbi:hypothetical protein BDQ12DRAFT_692887 [Crucibulum laeve]|uniref:Uncharacterized protein n=1 Tax=Crucibulum laeve TaxID=68775 RepID=A0A5C3LH04_9AGAR|nr:hypothetical protein BDQ12DRAFT_692887 [Crucibulum laeve]
MPLVKFGLWIVSSNLRRMHCREPVGDSTLGPGRMSFSVIKGSRRGTLVVHDAFDAYDRDFKELGVVSIRSYFRASGVIPLAEANITLPMDWTNPTQLLVILIQRYR